MAAPRDSIGQAPAQATGTAGSPNVVQGITPETWFSPLQPLPNFAPDSVQGRQWDYPVGYNLQITPRPLGGITFQQLRALVKRCDIMSVIINNQLDKIEARKWVIRPRDLDKKVQKAAKDDERIPVLTKFFEKPDQRVTFDQWLRPLLTDLFEIDAPAIYVRRNRGGGIYGLEYVDGATIALNVDQNGRRPLPPSPAYKQILKGVPATSYTTDQMHYAPRMMKSWGIYGRGPVEQTIVTINAAINRALFNQNYYTEGNIPDAIAWLPENFTPTQAAQFTEWWDSLYSGNASQKHKVKFVPGKGNFQQFKEPEMKNTYDDYIARLLCCAIGISPTPFIAQVNRATAGQSKESADEEGRTPIETWVCNVINHFVQGPQFFGFDDLEFAYTENEDQDPKAQSEILTTYVSKGVLSPDEARERLGEEPLGGQSAETGVITATGFVTLEDAKALTDANIKNAQTPKAPTGAEGGAAVDDKKSGDGKPRPAAQKADNAGGLKKKYKIRIDHERPALRAAEKKVVAAVHKVLKKQAREVGAQLKKKLHKAEETAETIALSIDLSTLEDIDKAVKDSLEEISDETGQIVLGELDLTSQDIVDQVNSRAVEWAGQRSSELVTLITDATRDELQRVIASGLEDNIGRDAIVDDIMGISDDGSDIFSEGRAELIASTEIANANSQGSLIGMQEAEDAGVTLKKEWDPVDDPCPICEDNANQGPIALDENFDSGDSAPTAHPNCRCVLLGVTED